MEVVTLRTPGLGEHAFLLEHEGRAILVDPHRDVDRFLSVAAERDLQFQMALATHLTTTITPARGRPHGGRAGSW